MVKGRTVRNLTELQVLPSFLVPTGRLAVPLHNLGSLGMSIVGNRRTARVFRFQALFSFDNRDV